MLELMIIIYIFIVFCFIFSLTNFTEVLQYNDLQKVLILILIMFWPLVFIILISIVLIFSPFLYILFNRGGNYVKK